jgi:hypothetical protein
MHCTTLPLEVVFANEASAAAFAEGTRRETAAKAVKLPGL